MTRRVRIGIVEFNLPEDWSDITDDVAAGAPITLARKEGKGVIQFSIAEFTGGQTPNICMKDLKQMLSEFGRKQRLGKPKSITTASGEVFWVQGDFSSEQEFIRVWYVTNGQDIALVSYVAQHANSSELSNDLRDANTILASIGFS